MFSKVTENAVDTIDCSVGAFMPMLRQGRYMHQSCIVKSKTGFWQLMVLGGKTSKEGWTASVESLGLLPYFRPGTMVKNSKGAMEPASSEWEEAAPMLTPRANFACLALKNFVYVFGGIMGPSEAGAEGHNPILAAPIERYMPISNEWQEMKISGAPRVAAFSWCPLTEGSICILGGSDGSLLSTDMYVIDFKKETVMTQYTDFEFSTAMGHLCFREKDNTLHHVGGFNSEGVNFWLKMGEK